MISANKIGDTSSGSKEIPEFLACLRFLIKQIPAFLYLRISNEFALANIGIIIILHLIYYLLFCLNVSWSMLERFREGNKHIENDFDKRVMLYRV